MLRKNRLPLQAQILEHEPLRLPQASTVAVVGGGLAGATSARALAEAGANVVVFERERAAGTQTSGHPGAVIFPMVAKHATPLRRFYNQSYQNILNLMNRLVRDEGFTEWHPRGAFHLLTNERLQTLWDQLPESGIPQTIIDRYTEAQVAKHTQDKLQAKCLFYPQAGYVQPAALCVHLLNHPHIQFQTHREALALERTGNHWTIHDNHQQTKAQAVILANGLDILRFPQTEWLPLRCFRGQLAYIAVNPTTSLPREILCHEGYLIPYCGEIHLAGATFHPSNRDLNLRQDSHAYLLDQLQRWLPGQFQMDALPLAGRVAFRAQSPDHLPMVGPVPDLEAFEQDFGMIRQGKSPAAQRARAIPGLFVSVGHASRGTVSCWSSAQILAAQIMGTSTPLDADLTTAVHPGRYLHRAIRRDEPLHAPHLALDQLPGRLLP